MIAFKRLNLASLKFTSFVTDEILESTSHEAPPVLPKTIGRGNLIKNRSIKIELSVSETNCLNKYKNNKYNEIKKYY